MRKRINFFQLVDKSKQKRLLRKKLTKFNEYLKTYSLSFKNIEITNTESVQNFDLRIKQNMKNQESAAICQDASDIVMMSEVSYSKFRSAIKPYAYLPPISKCRSHKKLVDQEWPLEKFVSPLSNWDGAFIKDPILKIKKVCISFLKNQTPEDDTFKNLLCGDKDYLLSMHTTH